MAGIDGHALWRLADVIKGVVPAAQQPDRMTARLSYVDDEGVSWYRIDGSSIDTPCVGGEVADVQPGEQVEVEIRGGMLYVTGNDDSPSVGEGRVTSIASGIVEPVQVRVAQAIEENAVTKAIADAAKRVADAIDQHFWTDTNGVHVTHATQEDWAANQSGPNVLINSVGQLFRDGLNNLVAITTEQGAKAISFFDGEGNAAANVVARFGADGSQIGRSDESHAIITPDSFRMHDSGGGTYFDTVLRESDTVNSYEFTWTGNGTSKGFYINDASLRPTSPIDMYPSVIATVDGIVRYDTYPQELTDYVAGIITIRGVYFDGDAPAQGTTVVMRVTTGLVRSTVAGFTHFYDELGDLSLTEGINCRASGRSSHAEGSETNASGAFSHAEGDGSESRGYYSHAEGYYVRAFGTYSHAQNEGTIAASDSQTAIGKFNEEDANDTYALIVGNGTSINRSNALTVDWSGNVRSAGNLLYLDAGSYGTSHTYLEAVDYSTGATGTRVGSTRRVSGTDIYNNVNLNILADGTRQVRFSSVVPWQEALDTHYLPGDTISGSCRAGGYVTNGAKDIRWTIPLSKPISGSVSCTSMSMTVRMAGTYIYGSSSGNANVPVGALTCSVTPSGIDCQYRAASAISGATNNSECSVQVSYNFTVS